MTAAPHPSDIVAPMDYTALAPQALTEPTAATLLPATRSYLNIAYATALGWRPLLLDLHVPTTGRGPYPVVIYAHGGSFLGGVKAMGPWHDLPSHGIAVVSVSYRLSGEAHFPEPVEDILAAVRWARANARHYNLDGGRISGWGSSAGAYLVTMAALSGNTPLGRPVGDHLHVSSTLSAVISHYGVADTARLGQDAFDNADEQIQEIENVARQFLGFDPGEDPQRAAMADPIALAADRGEGPPFLILHGESDHRVGLRQSQRLHQGLTETGIVSRLITVPGADHAGPEFTTPERIKEAAEFLFRTWYLPTPRT
ncbi:alpha/beta hydrolase [Streptomyces iranensis]|uniref:Acetyl esterase/lipase n=1 Tax=Streptomyces iranensis TaxID=576784 RepID=A0A060ZB56_9ACTN|nr:alpha/beta hydrolase [Streptomyces iranensis]MBP2068554.1 acetyl esterase/lipase [Streptomyces iranensis]CDR01308.1 Carboxylesterase type B [Streptomyces iranensis]